MLLLILVILSFFTYVTGGYFRDCYILAVILKKIQVLRRASLLTFSIGHWNLNSLVAHNLTKVALLKAYLSVHRFDIFCISETCLNSSITEDDDSLQITGYDLIRSDYPSNNKRGGVAIFYKNFLPLKLIDINYLSESILFEL